MCWLFIHSWQNALAFLQVWSMLSLVLGRKLPLLERLSVSIHLWQKFRLLDPLQLERLVSVWATKWGKKTFIAFSFMRLRDRFISTASQVLFYLKDLKRECNACAFETWLRFVFTTVPHILRRDEWMQAHISALQTLPVFHKFPDLYTQIRVSVQISWFFCSWPKKTKVSWSEFIIIKCNSSKSWNVTVVQNMLVNI